MDILKALDQEQVDFKNDRKMYSEVYTFQKNWKKEEKKKLLESNMRTFENDPAAQASQLVDGVSGNNQTQLNSLMTAENAGTENNPAGTNSNDAIAKPEGQAATMNTIDNSYPHAVVQHMKSEL